MVDLLKSPFIEKYRLFIRSFARGSDHESQIAEEINKALWQAIGGLKPSKSGSAVSRFVGNIPLPFFIPNPVSMYKDGKGAAEEIKCSSRDLI